MFIPVYMCQIYNLKITKIQIHSEAIQFVSSSDTFKETHATYLHMFLYSE